MLGQRLKALREKNQIVQRQVAARLEIDTAYVSKMEKGDKQVSRKWLPVLAEMFHADESELHKLWLADKIQNIIKGEPLAQDAIELISKNIKPSRT